MNYDMTFDYVSWEALATFVTGLLAVGAAFWVGRKQQEISRQQIENEKLALRLSLFEQRYELYDVTTRYMRATRFKNGVPTSLEAEFAAKSRKGLLLFPKKTGGLILEIAALGDEYQDLNEAKSSSDKQVRAAALARRTEIRNQQDQLFAKFDGIAEGAMRIDL